MRRSVVVSRDTRPTAGGWQLGEDQRTDMSASAKMSVDTPLGHMSVTCADANGSQRLEKRVGFTPSGCQTCHPHLADRYNCEVQSIGI